MMDVAVCSGDLNLVQELIRSGADVNELCMVEDEEDWLLILAIKKCYNDIALALLAAGADAHAKDSIGWTPLHWACYKRLEAVVQALVDRGGQLNERDRFGHTPVMVADWLTGDNRPVLMRLLRAGASCEGLSAGRVDGLFHHARHKRDQSAVRTLLKNGCSVSVLSREEQEALLHHACREGDAIVACTLLKNGCSVSILSKEEQEKLLHLACHEGDVFVARTLLENGYSVSIQSAKEQEELVHRVCRNGDVFVIEALLVSGCNINCSDFSGDTPLMVATEQGHEEVVKKLILAGANLGMQTASGNTALHTAATCDHIQCGILLAEGGASVRTKNNLAKTPLELAKIEFKEAIKQVLSFTTRKALCVIGNAKGGKSTLIASLQAESSSFLGKIFNRFRRLSDRRQRTAGIEIIPHCSQRYGEVLFFDFAGQQEYHGPHQMFLESLRSKPGVSMTLLLVVKMTEKEEAILHQLHRWLSPVALMTTPASPPQVIVIGSFLDMVTSKDEATAKLTRCIEATRKDLEELPLEFVGSSFLNCRQPQSKGIDQICNFLQDVPTPEFRSTHAPYSLAWVIYQIRSSITAQAVQLQEFSVWIQDNKENLPRLMPSPEEVCRDLSAAGHALYLQNKKDPPRSWLVLDLHSILHDVYKTLFSQSKEITTKFGLLHCHRLAKLFPGMDLEMVQQLLISLEFCLPVDPSILRVDLSKLTQSKEASGWLFFPALISTNHPQPTLEGFPEQSVCLCWQLRTAKKHSISARVLQTILLRLATHFVVRHRDRDGVQQHYCSVWWNGIMWQSTDGVDITVHITNNKVIQVVGTSVTSAVNSCQYLTVVISDILSTVHRLSPKLAAGAYIVHPPILAALPEGIIAPPLKELFPVERIRSSIRDHKEFVLSLKDSENHWNRMAVTILFGGSTPSLEDIERIDWPQPEPEQTHLLVEQSQTELHSEGKGVSTYCGMIPSGARALLDTLSTPDMRDVDELVMTAVAANWPRVALRLGVEGCVSEVVLKNHPNDCEGACRDMLNRWLRGECHTGEEERTWSTLLTALGRAGFVELERSLRNNKIITSNSWHSTTRQYTRARLHSWY